MIELVPPEEGAQAAANRAEKRAYLEQRDYRVLEVSVAEVGRDLATVLIRLATAIG